MPLRIANSRAEDRLPVDLRGVTPTSVARLSLDALRRTQVWYGNRPTALGELFTVSGDAADQSWHCSGDWSAVHYLGAGMIGGEIVVDGPVGRHAGAQMRGSRLEVRGDASDFLGAELRGGVIHVHGAAGDHAGAAYLGSPRGMTGGTILIHGAAGHHVGTRMRRGLIAVAGPVGDDAGAAMLAGTILAFGAVGARTGAGMRRGTIGLLAHADQNLPPPRILPTFRYACRTSLPMLGLLRQELLRAKFTSDAAKSLAEPVDLYHGDLLELGRGELLVRAR